MNDDRHVEKVRLLRDAAKRAEAYVEASLEAPAFPDADAVAGLEGLTHVLPAGPSTADEVIAMLDELGSPATVRSTGGRYFGFVTGGTEPEALAANILASTWDQNGALPVMSPTVGRIDEIAARWIVEILGLPAAATGGFCGGAAIANLTCVVAARDAILRAEGWDVAVDGLAGAPPITVVASDEIHIAATKAVRVAGLGEGNMVRVPTDEFGRARVSEMPALGPRSLVLMQAGNVNTGHSDPFGPIADRVAEAGGWLHVDGAFGLWAAASPDHRALIAGVERADSWAVDCHKWLNVPYDSAIAICARRDDLRAAMGSNAAYLPLDAERASMHLGLQMSQRARAVDTWAVLATKGRSGVAQMIGHTCDLATHMAARLRAEGAEILVEPVLNQALVAFGDDERTNAVVAAVQADGTAWAGSTVWQGRAAMRVSCSDALASRADVDAAVDAIVRCWHSTT